MSFQNVKLFKVNLKGIYFMKIKLFVILISVSFITSCAGDQYVGADNLIQDNSFRDIPTHDSVDCFGSCTVKIYNR